jgi:RNA polymerase sigma-70 factor (ECF subfamily)
MHGESLSRSSDAEHISGSLTEPRLFSVIFERHAAVVFKFLARQVNDEVANDLLADTFVAAFRSRARYDTSYVDARGWLFGIAVNIARHHRRTSSRQRMLQARLGSQPESAPEEESYADDRLMAGATSYLVAAALDDLKPIHREVLLLAAFDLDYEEMAIALHVPVGTVRSRLSRARMQMRELVGPGGQYEVTRPEAAASLAPTRQTGAHDG